MSQTQSAARSTGLQVASEDDDFGAAAARLRRELDLAPDDVAIARDLGEALAAGGDLRAARTVLEHVAERVPDGDDLLDNLLVDLSYVRMLDGDGAGAREAIERAVALQPDDQATALAQARIYEKLGEGELAAMAAVRVARGTNSPATLNELARICFEAERFTEAETVFRRLEAVDAEHVVFAQQGRTWCRIKRGNWRGAVALAIDTAQADRFEFTTALLAYAKDRLFSQMPAADAAAREAALSERFALALHDHAEQHRDDDEPDGWEEIADVSQARGMKGNGDERGR
jgi:tetratricopeptide (TPR) repeat protein